MQRIFEDPRVTRPYTDEQWQHISALGYAVDEELAANDVRLTMGGEPTFVSIDDMESAQWNTAALGKHKLALANDLADRLWNIYGKDGLIHYGQGKWYPGEPLPRWSINCFWRKDGNPIWNNKSLLTKCHEENAHNINDAKTFAQTLTQTLGLSPRFLIPGYEDSVYFLWKEGNLPANIDPLKNDLKSDDARARLLKRISEGLDNPTGFVLPVSWDSRHKRWRSDTWPLKRQHLYLAPGDSPMGLRLPLDSLPWEKEREPEHEQSLFAPLPPLGDYYGEVMRRYSYVKEEQSDHAGIQTQDAADVAATR